MTIIAIDPGTTESGFVEWTPGATYSVTGIRPYFRESISNLELLSRIKTEKGDKILAIERIAPHYKPVGCETLETCEWVGRFQEAHKGRTLLIYCRDVRIHHTTRGNAKDGEVSLALRDKYGNKGTKKHPGFFAGCSSHAWQAFALAAYVHETGKEKQ